jgi:phosphonate transport system substrate-binding protein
MDGKVRGMMRRILLVLPLLVCEIGWASPLFVGSVAKDPVKEMKKFLPLTNYLANHLRAVGVDEVKIVVLPNLSIMAESVRAGRVDLYIDSPFPSLYLQRFANSKFLARRWKEESSEYYAIIFVRSDSSISQWSDLKGKTIGFETPYSSTGYFLPKIDLLQKGLSLVESATPVPNRLAYQFTDGDKNTLAWVLRDKVAAGAMDMNKYLELTKEAPGRARVIDKSVAIPRQIVSHRAELNASLAAKIKSIMFAMDQSEEGRKALADFERTSKFDELPAPAMAPVLRGWKLIEKEFVAK